MRIVVLDGFTLNPGDLSWEAVERLGQVEVYDRTRPEEVMERLAGAEIALTNKVVLDATLLENLSPTLRYVGVLATGYNVVDVEAAKRLGICVTNIPAYSTASVAQMVFAHLLNLTNHVAHYTQKAKEEGKWVTSQDFCFCDCPLTELANRTMGVVGLGRIGMTVAQIATSFGMKVVAFTSKKQEDLPNGIQKADLDEIFTQSDVLSLHCPLTDETRNLIDARRLKLMKKNAILVNTSRGPVIDEAALAAAIADGTIGGAALDVMVDEPPQLDNPLFKLDNVIITPHVAAFSADFEKNFWSCSAKKVISFFGK